MMRLAPGSWQGEERPRSAQRLYRLIGTGFALALALTTNVGAQDARSVVSGGAQHDLGTSQCPAAPFVSFPRQSCLLGFNATADVPPSAEPPLAQTSTSSIISVPSADVKDPATSSPSLDLGAASDPDLIVSFEAWKAQQAAANDIDLKAEVDELERKEARDRSGAADASLHQDAEEVKPIDISGRSPTAGDNVTIHEGTAKPAAEKKIGSHRPSKESKPAIHRYNYASPDCSARIHAASAWSQHASSILHKSKDRYMLTPCAAKEHWVTIELCDEIRIDTIEVGMFEFFSGVVREVVVSVGGTVEDEEGGNDDDDDETSNSSSDMQWEQVGSFVGRNVRGAQSFTLPKPTSFHRFVRLDFPSFYGSEYYCPISSVKVFGMNQMEAFKWESRRKNHQAPPAPRSAAAEAAPTVIRSEASASTSQSTFAVPSQTSVISETIVASPQVKSTTATSAVSPTSTSVIVSESDVPKESGAKAANPSAQASQADTASLVQGTIAASSSSTTSVTPTPTASESLAAPETISTTVSNTADVSSGASMSSSAQMTRPSTVSRDNARADSSESIYAFIVRRLTALEGNATLATMYIEEQTKVVRELIRKQERMITDGKIAAEKRLQEVLAENVSLCSWCKSKWDVAQRAVVCSGKDRLLSFNCCCNVSKTWRRL